MSLKSYWCGEEEEEEEEEEGKGVNVHLKSHFPLRRDYGKKHTAGKQRPASILG